MLSSYIVFAMMAGLAGVAKPLVLLLLGDQWLPAVPYLQIDCIVYLFMPIHTSNIQAIKAMGRSDIYLKLEIAKKIVAIVLLLISIKFGVIAIALSSLVSTLASSLINSFPNKKLIDYGYFEQIKDLFNGVVPLALMVVAVYFVGSINLSDFLQIVIQAMVGGLVYVVTSYVFKNDSFNYILKIARGFIKK